MQESLRRNRLECDVKKEESSTIYRSIRKYKSKITKHTILCFMSAYRRYDENMTRILVTADCPRRRVENIHGGGIVREILTDRWILYTRTNLSLYLLRKLRIFMIISLSVLRNIRTPYYIKKNQNANRSKPKNLIDVRQLNAPKNMKDKEKNKQ